MKLGRSKEWTVAACLGQMQFTPEQAEIVKEHFQLDSADCEILKQIPQKNIAAGIPNDPLLYRMHEVKLLISS